MFQPHTKGKTYSLSDSRQTYTPSIQARVVNTEHCAWREALSKTNQDITSNSIPNANPCNIDLRAKYPEHANPGRDPVSLKFNGNVLVWQGKKGEREKKPSHIN